MKRAYDVINKLKKEKASGKGSKGSKGKGKGSKGKGSKGSKGGKVCAKTTPDGKLHVCFDYNDGTCSRRNCRFAHVCGICFKEGSPMWDCDHN